MSNTKNQLLRTALTSNAAFSAISGIALVLLNSQFQHWFELNIPFWLIGLGLLPFAWMGYQASRDESNMVKRGQVITIMDLTWVTASIGVLLIFDLTTIGQWVVGIVALIVADFALFQWLGMRRILQ